MKDMSLQELKDFVDKNFLGYFPVEYDEYTLVFKENMKINQTKTAIELCPPKNSGNIFSPVVYLEDMYKELCESEKDIDQILQGFADAVVDGMKNIVTDNFELFDTSNFNLGKVIFQLVNTKKNQALLQTIPHRDFFDLSVIYRLIHEKTDSGIYTNVINNEFMKIMNITEEEMYQAAILNTPVELTASVKSMDEVMEEITGEQLPPLPGPPMMIISSSSRIYGAIFMTYTNVLKKIADDMNSDLFILPSSIHEIIAIPTFTDISTVSDMVKEVNENDLLPEDFLSNSIYLYERATGKLSIAQ